ncbi:MAG TPA: hypothetical protein VFB94_04420 [Acidimicrobiales bacterium]|nr:hypothetical protein [Acidimicrobiales bacterium]
MGRHELWVELADTPGNLAAVAAGMAACGANILHLDVHAGGEATVVDRLVVQVADERSHELAEAAARCGATLLDLDDADPDVLVDDVVRALDAAHLLVAGAGPEARSEAIRRLIPADEVRVETVTLKAGSAGSPVVDALDRTDPSGFGAPWLVVVPYDHDGVQEVAVLRRWGRRFTATEAARCRALLRLAAQLHSMAQARAAAPAPTAVSRPSTTLERLVVLPDGGLVRLRHLGAGDRDAVEAYRARCSFPVPEVDDGMLRNDGRGHVGLAALVGADIVGIARHDDAQLAVGVEDRHQRRGIGTLLVTELSRLAGSSPDVPATA